jgi:hypothetical protein
VEYAIGVGLNRRAHAGSVERRSTHVPHFHTPSAIPVGLQPINPSTGKRNNNLYVISEGWVGGKDSFFQNTPVSLPTLINVEKRHASLPLPCEEELITHTFLPYVVSPGENCNDAPDWQSYLLLVASSIRDIPCSPRSQVISQFFGAGGLVVRNLSRRGSRTKLLRPTAALYPRNPVLVTRAIQGHFSSVKTISQGCRGVLLLRKRRSRDSAGCANDVGLNRRAQAGSVDNVGLAFLAFTPAAEQAWVARPQSRER